MTTLPDDVMQFLRIVADVRSSSDTWRAIAKDLIEKYSQQVGPREFKGTANETWALPPGTEERWKLNY